MSWRPLQSYLATGVAAGSTPLTIILKSSVVVQVQGTLSDAQGDVYVNDGSAYATQTITVTAATSIVIAVS
jgi:hypothetical protein